jgi:hypothetical protein
MVAFARDKAKRIRIEGYEAVALVQCIANAVTHLDPPEEIEDCLLIVMDRLATAYDIGPCPNCGCASMDGEPCDQEGGGDGDD